MTAEEMETVAQRVAELVAQKLGGAKSAAIDPNAIYTASEAARLVSMHPMTLREKLRIGIITGKRKAGGTYRIKGSELLKLA